MFYISILKVPDQFFSCSQMMCNIHLIYFSNGFNDLSISLKSIRIFTDELETSLYPRIPKFKPNQNRLKSNRPDRWCIPANFHRCHFPAFEMKGNSANSMFWIRIKGWLVSGDKTAILLQLLSVFTSGDQQQHQSTILMEVALKFFSFEFRLMVVGADKTDQFHWNIHELWSWPLEGPTLDHWITNMKA